MNLTDDDEPLVFHPAQSAGHLSFVVAQHLLDGSTQGIVKTFIITRYWIVGVFFTMRLWFWVKCLNNSWMDSHEIQCPTCKLNDIPVSLCTFSLVLNIKLKATQWRNIKPLHLFSTIAALQKSRKKRIRKTSGWWGDWWGSVTDVMIQV